MSIILLFFLDDKSKTEILPREERIYVFDDQYDEIHLSTWKDKIIVKQSDGPKIYLKVYVNTENYYRITKVETKNESMKKLNTEDTWNILSITYHKTTSWFHLCYQRIINVWYSLINENRSELIQYPAELIIPEDLYAMVTLNNYLGDIKVNSVDFKALYGENEYGSVEVVNVSTIDDIQIKATQGDVSLAEVKTGNIHIENKFGVIGINTLDCNRFVGLNTKGNISIQGLYANQIIQIKNQSGLVEVKDVDFEQELWIHTDSSNIICGLLGNEEEYNFRLSSEHGSIYFNKTKLLSKKNVFGFGEKTVTIDTLSGGIQVRTQ